MHTHTQKKADKSINEKKWKLSFTDTTIMQKFKLFSFWRHENLFEHSFRVNNVSNILLNQLDELKNINCFFKYF